MTAAVVAAGASALAVLVLRTPGARPAGGERAGAAVLLAAAAAVAGLLLDPLPVLAVVAAGAGALALRRRHLRRSARRRTATGVHESCEALVAELRAGREPVAALEVAARQWEGLREVPDGFRMGIDVPTTLRRVAGGPGAEDLRLVAGAWEVGQTSGLGLADAVERVTRSISLRRRSRGVVESELASARTTARMVALLPLAALAMGSGTGSDPWRFLLETPVGWGCLAAGGTLTLLGLSWIEWLADRAAPW